MFIQWCIKGVWAGPGGIDKATANAITLGGEGLRCNWWRRQGQPAPERVQRRLRRAELDRHVHDYDAAGPDTPFLSLTAGSVERERLLRFNRLRSAQDTALRFATRWGRQPGFLFHCWVLVGLKPAVEIQAVAEELRELHTYTDWSDFQLEGELTAKLLVPANQIQRWEYWDLALNPGQRLDHADNAGFQLPARLSNIRGRLGP